MVSREPDKLFKKFVDDFPKLALKSETPDTEWTKKILDYLIDLGQSEGFESYRAREPVEYLLDLCWIYAPENPPINWIEVGFEIEWSRVLDSILDEFSKLVDVKAYTKVLICFPKVDEVDDLIIEAGDMVRYNPFKFPDEVYLIIAFTKMRSKKFFTGAVINFIGNTIPLGSLELPKSTRPQTGAAI